MRCRVVLLASALLLAGCGEPAGNACPAIIDTTGQPVEQTVLTIQRWIAQARADQANGRLALAAGWATPSPPTNQLP